MRRIVRCVWAVALPLLLGGRAAAVDPSAPAAGDAAVRVEPAEIDVGMFYRGTKLHVEATAPAGCDVALACVGHETNVELKRKGKVGGVLWMNVGDVAFERVPSLFLQWSDVGGLRTDSGAARDVAARGYERVEARALPATADEDTRELFHEFIRLKEHEQLYLSRSGPARAASTFSADFWLPASVPPGKYEVQLLGGRGPALDVLAASTVTVKRVGLAALISSMAQTHGLLYGIASVLLAIGMGFLTGILFTASKKGH